ncbi:hypothetical protein T02_13513 [Trichinella nativa]|uniref:Uncharacterized protein n=1 Tax=Trichinella nativa TaxID=6335 RepID=A0A0V1KL09_9BILA|nr:hypothetical protein T02_13513 [Trichinella nativa]
MTRVPSKASPSTLTDLAAFIYYDGRFSSTQDQDQRQLARSKTRDQDTLNSSNEKMKMKRDYSKKIWLVRYEVKEAVSFACSM